MPYYRPCPVCGAALDPGERCDCRENERAALMIATSGRQEIYHAPYEELPKLYKRMGLVSSMKHL